MKSVSGIVVASLVIVTIVIQPITAQDDLVDEGFIKNDDPYEKRGFGSLVGAGTDLFKPTKAKKEFEITNPAGLHPTNKAEARLEQVKERIKGQKLPKLYREGDMKRDERLEKFIENAKKKKPEGGKREVLQMGKWPTGKDAEGKPLTKIPYVLDDTLGSDAKKAIDQAITDLANFTCVKFQAKEAADTNYVQFIKEDGCYSSVGRTGGKQDISIGSGCEYKGTVLHEMMHTLGFFHEHTRPDRDEFIKVHMDKVVESMKDNFDKYDHNLVSEYGAPYDYYSIMHYNQYAFSKSMGDISIEPIKPDVKGKDLGQRHGLTETDRKQINAAYCDQPFVTTTTTTTTTIAPTTTTTTTLVPTTTTTTLVPTTTTTTLVPTTTTTTLVPTTTTTVKLLPGLDATTSTTTTTTTTRDPKIGNDLGPTKPITLEPLSGGEKEGKPTEKPAVKPDENKEEDKDESKEEKGEGEGGQEGPCQTCQPQPQDCSSPYPCWPSDFAWSSTGFPQPCGCNQPAKTNQTAETSSDENDKRCHTCKCLDVKSMSTPKSWLNNHLCHKSAKKNPHIQLLRSGFVPGKRCLLFDDSEDWDDIHLCFDKGAPYKLYWSEFDDLNKHGHSRCLKINEPQDWAWNRKYLCSAK